MTENLMTKTKTKQKKNEQRVMPTCRKEMKKGAIARELEMHDKLTQRSYIRNQFRLKTRAKNYEMERDRRSGILANNRIINNREPQLLSARRDILQHHINYMEPIIGAQGRYTHV